MTNTNSFKSINLKDFIESVSYNKQDVFTKQEVLDEIIRNGFLEVVDTLPLSNINSDKIYLLHNTDIDTNDEDTVKGFDLYIYKDNDWEKIDELKFDLDDYYTKTQIDNLLLNKSSASHSHTTSDVSDSSAYTNIGSSANSTQATINTAIDTKLSTIVGSTDIIDNLVTDNSGKVLSAKQGKVLQDTKAPINHADPNTTYGVSTNINYGHSKASSTLPLMNGTATVGNETSTFARGDHVHPSDTGKSDVGHTHTKSDVTDFTHTHSKSEITDFPSSMTPSSHSHGSVNNNGQVNSDISSVNKVVVTDNSDNIKTISTLPLGSVTHQDITGKINYTDIVDDLNSNNSDKPLSAKQGKELRTLVDEKASGTHEHNTGEVKDTSAYSNIGSSANATQKTINNNINTKLGLKADSNDVYTKSQTLTISEITQAIADGVSNVSLFEVVNDLPTSNIKGNKFYLIANNESVANNVYDIYIYINNGWEQLDSLEFDIDNYYTITQIDTLLNGKVDTTDSRLTDSRTPKSHSHGNITNTGAIGSASGKPIITTTNGVLTTSTFGTTSGTFVEGNDSRLSDARTPTTHSHGNLQNDGKVGTTNNTSKNVVTDSNGKITTEDKYTHPSTHASSMITESSALSNIGTSANSTQHNINTSIDNLFNTIIDTLDATDVYADSNKSIGQVGDTINLLGKLYDTDVEGKTISFYKGNTLLGNGVTNNRGIAILPYVCTGSGIVEITTKYGTVVSEPYTVGDYLFYDDGVTDPKTATWSNYNNRATITIDETGTLISATGSGNIYYMAVKPNETATNKWSSPFTIEFDVVSYNSLGHCIFGFEDSAEHNYYFSRSGWGITTGSHVKITYDGTTLTLQSDNNTPISETVSINDNMNIYFRVNNGGTLKYKNFKMYLY